MHSRRVYIGFRYYTQGHVGSRCVNSVLFVVLQRLLYGILRNILISVDFRNYLQIRCLHY